VQLAHQAHVGLPQYYIQNEVASEYFDRIEDQGMKQQLLMGSEKMLSQALKLETSKPQPNCQ
jgi:hypothetical protein